MRFRRGILSGKVGGVPINPLKYKIKKEKNVQNWHEKDMRLHRERLIKGAIESWDSLRNRGNHSEKPEEKTRYKK